MAHLTPNHLQMKAIVAEQVNDLVENESINMVLDSDGVYIELRAVQQALERAYERGFLAALQEHNLC